MFFGYIISNKGYAALRMAKMFSCELDGGLSLSKQMSEIG